MEKLLLQVSPVESSANNFYDITVTATVVASVFPTTPPPPLPKAAIAGTAATTIDDGITVTATVIAANAGRSGFYPRNGQRSCS